MAEGSDGGGSAKALSNAEWEQIETMTHQTRRVGQLMAVAAPREVVPQKPFDVGAWKAFSQRRVPTPLNTKFRNKKEEIHCKLRQKQEKEDLGEIWAGAGCPTVEKFGGRIEPFLVALIRWSEQVAPGQLLDAVVSIHYALSSLSSHDEAHEALAAAAERACTRAGGAASLAEQAASVVGSRYLVAPSFHGPHPLKLYPEQLKVAEEVCSAVTTQQPILLRFATPPSGGKSSAAALIGASVRAAVGDKVFVIYACFSNPVRVDVARVVLAASVPFAIVSRGLASPAFCCYFQKPKKLAFGDVPPPDLEGRVAYSLRLMSKCDRRPTVLVCDLESARAFSLSFPQSVLILDELTTSSEANLDVMAATPAFTVVASATVPPLERMPAFVSHFFCRHPGARTADVSSKRLAVSIMAKDAQGRAYFPHQFSSDPIQGNGHLERFYGPKALCILVAETQGQLEWRDVVSHDAIRAACFRLLAVERTAQTLAPPVSASLDCHDLATGLSHNYPGFSLVVVPKDPENFYHQGLSALLQNQQSLKRLRDEHLRTAAAEAKQALKRVANERRDEAPRQSLEDKTQWWPIESVINSREHQKAWACGQPAVEPKLSLPLPDAVVDSSACALVESCLAGAVLVETQWGDRAFELTALALCDQGLPSFVVADKRIIYGVNFPIARVLVLADAAELDYDQLRQLCGRAGRTGRASYGEVVFRDAAALIKALSPPPPEAVRAPVDDRFSSKWGTSGYAER